MKVFKLTLAISMLFACISISAKAQSSLVINDLNQTSLNDIYKR